MPSKTSPAALVAARQEFLDAWARLGPAWGVSRTMSQIHALLMVADAPMNTDDVMAALAISRGNAHKNIRELCAWGLLKETRVAGERKDYFVAEKDVWKVVQIITRERKRKELQPVLEVLGDCLEGTRGLRDGESKAFRRQLKDLLEFAELADSVMERVASKRSGTIVSWAMRLLK